MPLELNGTTGVSAVQAGAVESGDLASGAIGSSDMPAGSVIQVVSTTKTETFSNTTFNFTDVPGLSVNITPSNVDNKILIIASISLNKTDDNGGAWRLVRSGTPIAIGDASGSVTQGTSGVAGTRRSNPRSFTANFLDTPSSTSTQNYKIQVSDGGNGTIYVNRGRFFTDSDDTSAVSTITVMEIAG